MTVNVLKGKSLARALAAYAVGFAVWCLTERRTLWLAVFFVLLLLGAARSFLFARRDREALRRQTTAWLLTALAATCALVYASVLEESRFSLGVRYADEKPHELIGTVTEILYEKPFGSAYAVVLTAIDRHEEKGSATLNLSYFGDLCAGDEVRFSATVQENEPEYDFYNKARGIYCSADAETVEIIGTATPDLQTRIGVLADKLAANFDETIGETTEARCADFATALMLGRRDALDASVRLAFRRTGISHLLAVSGLHLSVIVGGLDLLFTRLTFPRKRKDVLLILTAVFFAFLCGLSASILRAAIMLSIYYFADLIGERSDSVTSLFFAVALILTVRPNAVFDAGLWLSFAATFGILLISPALAARKRDGILRRIGHFLLSLTTMTLTATLFTLPISWLMDGGISVVSPLTNLVFVPLVQVLLYLLVVLSVLSFLPVVPALLGKGCGILIGFIERLVEWVSEQKGVYVSLRFPFVPVLMIALLIGLFVIFSLPRLRLRRVFALAGAFAIAFGVCLGVFRGTNADLVRLTLESDGKNDAMLFSHAKNVIVIDASTGGYETMRRAAETLGEQCETEIDLLVLTHLHTYHTATLEKLAGKIRVHRVLVPEPENAQEEEIVSAIERALGDRSEVVRYLRDGDSTVSCGRLTISLPNYALLSRSSHPVLTLFAEVDGYDGRAFAYLGSSAPEMAELAENAAGARVIFMGAHGPVTKNLYDISLFDGCEALIYANDGEAEWGRGNEGVILSQTGGTVRVTFE